MSRIVIGRAGKRDVTLDVDVLLRTRLLVQADSGGGKSWLLRRLAEQLFGKVQVVLIDPEGEFATLREKFGYVLVGKGGETPADPRSAETVAHKLLELRASAVCDIYELKHQARHHWLRLFLEAMIDAPKNLWHPCIVIVDEAHVFCPEKGKGESEAYGAMADLCTRGRKRGYCAVFATQRLGNLSKDASSMLQNRLIGPTFEDINRKRAADVLGVLKSDERAFFKEIQLLEEGNFFALGRAISKERILVRVGPVTTTHPEMGSSRHAAEPPPPPEKVKALLPKLADLPKAAEEEARSVADFKRQIRELKTQLRSQPVQKVQPSAARPAADPRAIERAVREVKAQAEKQLVTIHGERKALLANGARLARDLIAMAEAARKAFGGSVPDLKPIPLPKINPTRAIPAGRAQPAWRAPSGAVPAGEPSAPPKRASYTPPVKSPSDASSDVHLKAGALRMLRILAQWHPEEPTRRQLSVLAGFAETGGTFKEYIASMRSAGFLSESGDRVAITEPGLAFAGDVPPKPSTTEQLVAMWRPQFKAGAGRMLDFLVEQYPGWTTRQELGEATGFAQDGGTFKEYFGALRSAGLLDFEGERLRAAEALFP